MAAQNAAVGTNRVASSIHDKDNFGNSSILLASLEGHADVCKGLASMIKIEVALVL